MEKKERGRYGEILSASLKLGMTSFGGPAAHLGYFRDEYVKKRQWLDDRAYADLVALCQFLPGPASSQVGIGVGLIRGGIGGAMLSWFGFTMPSVIILMLFAYLVAGDVPFDTGWIRGLKIVAVAIILHALIGMGKNLTPDAPRIALAVLAGAGVLLVPTAWGQIGVIVLAGLVGYILYRNRQAGNGGDDATIPMPIGKKAGALAWVLFFGLLALLPVVRQAADHILVSITDSFYRVGSIVFGGGHVVLPMLEREVVPQGYMDAETFIAGYGAAQAVPGPLFTLSAYIGMIMDNVPGALVAVVAMFLPSFLLVVGTLPFWSVLRKKTWLRAALTGVNAAVVGILAAALINPVIPSSIFSVWDVAVAALCFWLLQFRKTPPWGVVAVAGVLGALLHAFL
ncbi:chromate efflux transporter [Bhargavaea beijingensis]|uniref:Chromate transporter n=1 Tax=Bhargavaea beijingensis TaxID=426756 RepID=A0A1G7G879_9BACL|nr:chromate efflux transporter [Bhargavaea beijingensis]MCW1927430.1 chromate efflux transporter [Bhargavaea beijingensis]SDE84322.1 chromate transporter [Bhargavaea beijingensis]